jgi:signal transduction histidine kinase
MRIGQEAIMNAVRHSRARNVRLELRFDERSTTLSVSDDGCGFEYNQDAPHPDDHYGLTMMRERAEQLHSAFTIATGIDRGTRVDVVMPIRHVRDTLATADS